MISKSWLCGLLTVAILACGCADQAKTAKIEKTSTKTESKVVKLETSMGDIVVELNAEAAPVTVENFLQYVRDGFYDETIFHRVIHGFMIQGGGFTADMAERQTRDPITNEASNGLRNSRGTIAMARTTDPNSATSQFFINHVDNPRLDYVANANPGYAVFGKVTDGMYVVDAIARVETATRTVPSNVPGDKPTVFQDVPVEPVVLKSAKIISE